MRRALFAVPLVLFVTLAVWFAAGLQRDPRIIPSALIDRPVPEFMLPPLPGFENGLSSHDLQGQVQLVNFFASWCGPCRIEQPVLMELTNKLDVLVQGINYKDAPQDALMWLQQFGNPFGQIGADQEGRTAIEWGVTGVPETFVIDAAGRIRYKHVGPVLESDVEETILPLIKELQG